MTSLLLPPPAGNGCLRLFLLISNAFGFNIEAKAIGFSQLPSPSIIPLTPRWHVISRESTDQQVIEMMVKSLQGRSHLREDRILNELLSGKDLIMFYRVILQTRDRSPPPERRW